MRETIDRRAARGATGALCALLLMAAGCDEPRVVTETDAGPPATTDGGPPAARDAGREPPADGGSADCATHADCDDGDPCTDNTCEAGRCWSARAPGCFDCETDADCDDDFVCSIEACVGGICSFEWDNARCECMDRSHCDDGNPTTADACVDFRCVNESTPCSEDADCDDADSCTTDACLDGTCSSSRIPGCGTSCPDRDGDGHGSRFCFGGDDCDDANPAVHPGASEVCDDGVDNDCDGRADAVDDDCATGATDCAAAIPLTPGTPETGAIIHDSSGGGMTRAPCGEANYFSLTLTELSDVEVTVTLSEPPPPTPVPGCPECTPDHSWEYWFNLFFEQTCGDVSTDLAGSGGGCRVYSNDSFFGGSPSHTISLRRVEAGTYTVELQAQDFFGWMPVAIEYSLTATVTPSDAPMCGGGALGDGATVSGRTGSGVDAFGTDCAGRVAAADERVHSFSLSRRRRVRLEAAGTPDPTTGVAPGLRLGLYGACDPSAPTLECLEHTGRECHARSTLEAVLDAGDYTVVVEGRSGGDHAYDLTLTTEGPSAACRDADGISASGAFSGSTTGETDDFRDPDVCGDNYAPDAVHRVDVATESRVVLDLIASYPNATLSLYTGCTEARVAGGRGRSRIDTTLSAGTYWAVVDGETETDAGDYVLNATFVPASP